VLYGFRASCADLAVHVLAICCHDMGVAAPPLTPAQRQRCFQHLAKGLEFYALAATWRGGADIPARRGPFLRPRGVHAFLDNIEDFMNHGLADAPPAERTRIQLAWRALCLMPQLWEPFARAPRVPPPPAAAALPAPAAAAPPPRRACTGCGSSQGSLKRCGGCRHLPGGGARYCSVVCQHSHWPAHKETCRAAQASKGASGAGPAEAAGERMAEEAVEVVMQHTGVSRDEALAALENNAGDAVSSIMELTL